MHGLGDADQSRLPGSAVRGFEIEWEGHQAHEDGGRGDAAPPRHAAVDVDVFEDVFETGCDAISEVEAKLMEEADLFGDVGEVGSGAEVDVIESYAADVCCGCGFGEGWRRRC